MCPARGAGRRRRGQPRLLGRSEWSHDPALATCRGRPPHDGERGLSQREGRVSSVEVQTQRGSPWPGMAATGDGQGHGQQESRRRCRVPLLPVARPHAWNNSGQVDSQMQNAMTNGKRGSVGRAAATWCRVGAEVGRTQSQGAQGFMEDESGPTAPGIRRQQRSASSCQAPSQRSRRGAEGEGLAGEVAKQVHIGAEPDAWGDLRSDPRRGFAKVQKPGWFDGPPKTAPGPL